VHGTKKCPKPDFSLFCRFQRFISLILTIFWPFAWFLTLFGYFERHLDINFQQHKKCQVQKIFVVESYPRRRLPPKTATDLCDGKLLQKLVYQKADLSVDIYLESALCHYPF
jgi:hypothetical protein